MTEKTEAAPLPPRRAVIAVRGAEARDFLNGLLTNSVLALAPGAPVFAALLTPQGKILHTLFVHADPEGDGVLMDAAADGADDLIRRLTLYRLRRNISIERRDDLSVRLGEGAPDPRHPGLPARALVAGPERADWPAYNETRLSLGIPDQGADYGPEEVFPADANLDLLNGVDLKKGCFVGQEVVSRMHRKGGVRKRMCALAFTSPAPVFGAEIMDETGAAIGSVRSTLETKATSLGLALARLDRLAAAQGALRAGDIPVTLTPP